MRSFEEKISRYIYRFFGQQRYDFIKRRYKSIKFLLLSSFKKQDPAIEYYINNLENTKIDEYAVLIECMLGNNLSGNGFYIAEELCKTYPEFRVTIAVKNKKMIQYVIDQYDLKINVITRFSKEYNQYLIESKYLFNDSAFPEYFIKRKGQIYINTWHGTPLKSMGRYMKNEPLALGNTQRNFMQADILSVNNSHTAKMISDDYMLEPLGLKNILINASPRNSIFFNEKRHTQLRKILKLENKKIVLWMPTWRGSASNHNDIETNINLVKRMSRIISKLDESIEFYANIHPLLSGKISINELGLKPIPKEIEIYDFTAISDVLLTDYSSILFDYANLNKPIILDIFDIEEYSKNRGFCLEIKSFPFIKVENENELLHALASFDQEVIDYGEFNALYNPKENGKSTKQFLKQVFMFDKQSYKTTQGKQKVLIYPGVLLTNGITTSFLNLLNTINREKREYIIWLPHTLIHEKSFDNIVKVLKTKVNCIVSPKGMLMTSYESKIYQKLMNGIHLDELSYQLISSIMRREIKRIFGDVVFDHVIHFSGYETIVLEIFKYTDSKLYIWVHNNMKAEYELKKNFNLQSLQSAYDKAFRIAVVNDIVKEILNKEFFTKEQQLKVKSVHNTVNIEDIKLKAMYIEKYMNDKLMKILQDSNITKFINIGRFSPEKGHARLIKAFTLFRDQNPLVKAKLFLIGGYGISYEETLLIQQKNKYKDDIFLYQNINPLPILKYSDLMVLSSYHEGLPMVFFEAIVLKVTILSTAIPGPKEFLESGYGYICENSTQGLVSGMQKFIDGELVPINKDLKSFNQKAKSEFEALFEY